MAKEQYGCHRLPNYRWLPLVSMETIQTVAIGYQAEDMLGASDEGDHVMVT